MPAGSPDTYFTSTIGGPLSGAEQIRTAQGIRQLRANPVIVGARSGDALGQLVDIKVTAAGVEIEGRLDEAVPGSVAAKTIERVRRGGMKADLVGKQRDGTLNIRACAISDKGAPIRLVPPPAMRGRLADVDLRIGKLGVQIAGLNGIADAALLASEARASGR